jgi:hypothetical protein
MRKPGAGELQPIRNREVLESAGMIKQIVCEQVLAMATPVTDDCQEVE